MQKEIGDRLAKAMLAGHAPDGAAIRVDRDPESGLTLTATT